MLIGMQLPSGCEIIEFNREKNFILLKVPQYRSPANVAYLCTTRGNYPNDWHDNDTLSRATLFVGSRGGIGVTTEPRGGF